MNNRTLLIIFIFFGVVYYAVTQIFWNNKSNEFNSILVNTDTASITEILLEDQLRNTELVLKKETDRWIASNDLTSIKALSERVAVLLNKITYIRSVAILSEENIQAVSEYRKEALTVAVFREGASHLTFSFYPFIESDSISRQFVAFNFQNDDKWYKVPKTHLPGSERFLDFYRQKHFWTSKSIPLDTFLLSYRNLDTIRTFDFPASASKRMASALDSSLMAIQKHLEKLNNMEGQDILDDFDPWDTTGLLQWKVTLMNLDSSQLGYISMYQDSSRQAPFILYSSQNPDYFFSSDSTGLYARIFAPFNQLLDSLQME